MTDPARLYGGSLYELAAEEALEHRFLEELECIQSIFQENPEYLRLLEEPSIPVGERTDLLHAAFGDSIKPYLLNFLKLLCEHKLLREFPGCVREFKNRYFKDHRTVQATVTSAYPLSEEERDALSICLKKISKKTVLLEEKTDSSLIGGLQVEMEGKLLNGTVQGRLLRLGRMLRSPEENY